MSIIRRNEKMKVCRCGHHEEEHKSLMPYYTFGKEEPEMISTYGGCTHVSYHTTKTPIKCSCPHFISSLFRGAIIISTGRMAGKSAFYEMWREAHKNFLKAGKKFE